MHTQPLLIVATMLVSTGVAAGPAVSGAATPGGQAAAADIDVVVTVGEGLVRAAPDRATVTLAAEARDKSPCEAQRQNAQAMTAVKQALRGAGLAEPALRTLAYVLCMAIVGGAIVPVIQGFAADQIGILPSFVIPLVCYLYIA